MFPYLQYPLCVNSSWSFSLAPALFSTIVEEPLCRFFRKNIAFLIGCPAARAHLEHSSLFSTCFLRKKMNELPPVSANYLSQWACPFPKCQYHLHVNLLNKQMNGFKTKPFFLPLSNTPPACCALKSVLDSEWMSLKCDQYINKMKSQANRLAFLSHLLRKQTKQTNKQISQRIMITLLVYYEN